MDIRKQFSDAFEAGKDSKGYADDYNEVEDWLINLHYFDCQILEEVFPKPCSILDAMMGTGRHIEFFARKGYDIHGADYNPHMVEAVKERLSITGAKAPLFTADVTDLSSIKSGSFDGVLCMGGSLGCVPVRSNRQRAVDGFARILSPGGRLVIHLNNRYSMTYADFWTLCYYLKNRKNGAELGDSCFFHSPARGMFFNHLFSKREAEDMIRSSGLKIERMIGLDRHSTGPKSRLLPLWMSGGFIIVAKKD